MKTATVCVLGAVAALGLAAQMSPAGPVKKLEPLTKEDFVAKAIASCIGEMKLHEKAAKDAKSEDVRRFAQKMADEHKKVNDRLMNVAKEMKLGVVQGFDKNSKEIWDRISRLEGEAFDREYVKHVLKSHADAINFYENARPRDADARIKGLAEEVLPTLRQHEKEARELASRLKIS
jgi:putative membrane protein